MYERNCRDSERETEVEESWHLTLEDVKINPDSGEGGEQLGGG